jgi:hypothetical protein
LKVNISINYFIEVTTTNVTDEVDCIIDTSQNNALCEKNILIFPDKFLLRSLAYPATQNPSPRGIPGQLEGAALGLALLL